MLLDVGGIDIRDDRFGMDLKARFEEDWTKNSPIKMASEARAEIKAECLCAQASERRFISNAGNSGDDRRGDQGDDDESQCIDENLAAEVINGKSDRW